jgi:uncharacterized ferritin-like protein (DUF455 family)
MKICQSGSPGLAEAAAAILATPDPWAKAALSARTARAWAGGQLNERPLSGPPPGRPARPGAPPLRPPREVPRRRIGPSPKGRIALLHALAHIELNAIDLAWDILARFSSAPLPRAFRDDWVRVAAEEAEHFLLLSERLTALGAAYGDFPAHDGLWEAAEATAGDLLARLAVVPLVLEARGLDVTPGMIERLSAVGDDRSADILRHIYCDEIGHVAIGKRWFDHVCAQRALVPEETWRQLVATHFKGVVKPPFNGPARRQAGMEAGFYEPLTPPSPAP